MLREELVWEKTRHGWHLIHRQYYSSSTASKIVAYVDSSRELVGAWIDMDSRAIILHYPSVRAAKKDLYNTYKEYYLDA